MIIMENPMKWMVYNGKSAWEIWRHWCLVPIVNSWPCHRMDNRTIAAGAAGRWRAKPGRWWHEGRMVVSKKIWPNENPIYGTYIYMHVWHLYYMYTFMCFGKLTGECAWTWGLKSWDGDSTFWGTKIAPISYLFFVWNMIIRFGSPSCNYQPWRASRVQLVSATFFTQDIGCIPDDLEKNFRWFSNKFSTIHYDHLWFTMSIYDSLWASMIHYDHLWFTNIHYIDPVYSKHMHCRQPEISGQDLRDASCHGRRWMATETLTMKEMLTLQERWWHANCFTPTYMLKNVV